MSRFSCAVQLKHGHNGYIIKAMILITILLLRHVLNSITILMLIRQM